MPEVNLVKYTHAFVAQWIVHNVADVEVVGSSPAEGAKSNMRLEIKKFFYFKDVNKRGDPDQPPFDPRKKYELMERWDTWDGRPRGWATRGVFTGSEANNLVKLTSRANKLRRDDFEGAFRWQDLVK